jgi:2-isopropylmalate synthase
LGEGQEVLAASFVELVYEKEQDKKKIGAWGVASDNDITASGLKAVVAALNGFEGLVLSA